MNIILISIGIFLGSSLLTLVGCYFYWYEEDKKFDREMAHTNTYLKNLRAKKWCLDARGRALDDAIFWNDLARIYIDAGLYSDANNYMGMARGILIGISDCVYKEENNG